jgi:hypothetical protein
MKTKKIIHLSDLDPFPVRGPHYRDRTSTVPALYLLSLIGSDELKEHPEVSAYIERARRQLNAEAKKEHDRRWFNGD